MDRSELQERLYLSKSQHDTFSSSERSVAVLHPVILPSARLTAVEIAGRSLNGAELARLGRTLDQLEPRHPAEVGTIRLLLFTGAGSRKS